MQFSVCNRSIFEIFVFCEKCKQTAEISWLLFWDVKISKKVINKIFVIFYRDVKTYLDLCCSCTQFEIAHFPEILFLLFAVKLKWKKLLWKIQLILLLWCPFRFASTGLVLAAEIFKVGMWIILCPREKSFPIKSSESIKGLVIRIFIFF